jgi:hypothetical protein
MGQPSIDNDQKLGLHGRISNAPAEKVLADGCWEKDSYKMWVQGKAREASVYGEKLELSRKITTWMDKPKIILEDTVENIGSEISPLMVLYHVNIGFPVLDEDSRLLKGKGTVEPRDMEAKDGIENFDRFDPPKKGYSEKIYFHNIEADKEGYSNVAIVNEGFDNNRGIGIWLKFKKDTLPLLTQWKQMGMDEYVCAIEPCNSTVLGRKTEREKGNLKFIEPGETVNFNLEFNILKSNDEIGMFKEKIRD